MKQLPFNMALAPSYAADDFMVSDCNNLVWQWLEKWPDWPSYGAIIIGDEASGKTHLLRCWQARTNASWIELEDEHTYRSTALAIDDADMWDNGASEEALFHLLNQVKEQEQTILLTASVPPSQWGTQLKDLSSRLLGLPVWQLDPPDEIVLVAALTKHFADNQITVDPSVIHYIVTRTERSFAAISNIAKQIDGYALEMQRPITTALIRQWMKEQSE